MSIWEEIDSDIHDFIKWEFVDKDWFQIAVRFINTEPIPFKNKWGREQFKFNVYKIEADMEVYKDSEAPPLYYVKSVDTTIVYSFPVGQRLIRELKRWLFIELKFDLLINRYGKGYDTKYAVLCLSNNKQTTLQPKKSKKKN